MALVIKKTVDLSSLGEQYKDIELNFRSIPAPEVSEMDKQKEKLDDSLGENVAFMLQVLQKQYITGKQADEEITKDDLALLDVDGLVYCFRILTGQDIDPKVENESSSSSSTEPETPQK